MNEYKIISREEKPNRILSFEIEADSNFVSARKEKALKNIGRDFELKGFRKGTVPPTLIEKNVNQNLIWEETVHCAVEDALFLIIKNEKVETWFPPRVKITKAINQGNVCFNLEFYLTPKIKLGNYKEIAKSIEKNKDDEISQNEIDEYVNYIRKQKSGGKEKPEEWPIFDDTFVQSLGKDFTNTEKFLEELKKNMSDEKKRKNQESRRMKIIEKIISESTIEIPEILVEEETERMIEQFKHDIKRWKMEPEEYFKQIKKTEEDLKKELKPEAEKRVKMNLILPEIAKTEKISVDRKLVETEVEAARKIYPEIESEKAHSYFEKILTNQKIFEFLENL